MRQTRRAAAWSIVSLLALSMASASEGQETQAAHAGGGGEELAKKLSNPISDLVSVPFQFNWEQGVGPDDQTRFILNVQPVMPFALNDKLNLITRVIVPLVSQPPLAEGGQPAFGVGDVLTSFFFSPVSGGGFTWGVGPAISLPSTTLPTLGTEKWSVGPTVVALQQSGPWTFGALANQVWSIAGNENRQDVNQLFLQPFVARQLPKLWTLSLNSEMTANWEAEDDKWTVPINLAFAKLSSFGPFPASYQFGGGVFVEHPDAGPKWKLRAAIVLLLPHKK